MARIQKLLHVKIISLCVYVSHLNRIRKFKLLERNPQKKEDEEENVTNNKFIGFLLYSASHATINVSPRR